MAVAFQLPDVDEEAARIAASLSIVEVDVLCTLVDGPRCVCELRFDDETCSRMQWVAALKTLRQRGLIMATPWENVLEWGITNEGLEALGCYVIVHMDAESGLWSVHNPARSPTAP